MNKLFTSILFLATIIALSIMTMVFGYGLEIKNWIWVIGGPVLTFVLTIIFQLSIQDKS